MAAKTLNTESKKLPDMGISKDDADFWSVDRMWQKGFDVVFDANNHEIAPNSASITAFNERTGWVERMDRKRVVNGSRPLFYEQYQSPLQGRKG